MDEIYEKLIELAEKRSVILAECEYDPEIARENELYRQLEAEEQELLKAAQEEEDRQIIENSFLFAYDIGFGNKEK